MKLSRIVATGAAFSLVAASVLLGASAANAADYYETDGANFPAEAPTYITDWFHGNVTTSPGGYANTPGGLEMTGGAQLLNGGTPVTGLKNLVDNAGFALASGNATFQISMFTLTGDTGFTTLRPVAANTVPNSSDANLWRVSQGFGSIVPTGTYSVDELIAEMDTDYKILAYGLFVSPGDVTVVESITWNGDTTYFFAEPDPLTYTVSPSSLTVAELADSGVSFDFSGLAGVEVLTCSIAPAAGGDSFGEQDVNVTGEGTASYVFTGAAAVGDYVITCVADNPDISFAGDFTVTAALAATGAPDGTPYVLGGGLLLLLGAGAIAFAVRRKKELRA